MDNRMGVLITGSSRGLGRELAYRFSGDNAHIILTAREKDRLFAVREEIIQAKWANCDCVAGDLREDWVIKELSGLSKQIDLDILINNVGVRSYGTFKDMSNEQIQEMIEVNLLSTIKITKAVYPIFLKKNSGMIININSIAGKNPNAYEAVYCASKYGLRGFFDSFRFEARAKGIKILSVYLGAMDTEMTKGRKVTEIMISPKEASEIIHALCTQHQTVEIPEIDLWRNPYQ